MPIMNAPAVGCFCASVLTTPIMIPPTTDLIIMSNTIPNYSINKIFVNLNIQSIKKGDIKPPF